MSQDKIIKTKKKMVVMAMVDEWASLTSLLQNNSGDGSYQVTFRSQGSHHVSDLSLEDQVISLHYVDLKEDMPEETIFQTMDVCFKSCNGGVTTFLLLIQGGYYTKKQSRMIELMQAHFGGEALNYLVVLSVEDGKVTDTLDDALLDLINICTGRYCRITSATVSGGLHALLEMANNVLSEHGAGGYTEHMLTEAKRRCTEDSAMNMLKQKVLEAEEKERAYVELLQNHEERRAREMELLKTKHTEERRKEEEGRKQLEAKKESLQEAVLSHRSMLQLHEKVPDDDETKKLSVVLLGLTSSGKSSALNLILRGGDNRYSLNGSDLDSVRPTVACERKEMSAGGKRLILVDTPELWDEDGVENTELVKDCLALALPGPHVFLLVLQVGRFTQCESEMLGHLQKTFGREVAEHIIVLFVQLDGNHYRPLKISDYVTDAHPALRDLIRKCGSRFHELTVTKPHDALSYPQVKELLSGINKLVASHGGQAIPVRRFSPQELQQRNNMAVERKDEALENNSLLRYE